MNKQDFVFSCSIRLLNVVSSFVDTKMSFLVRLSFSRPGFVVSILYVVYNVLVVLMWFASLCFSVVFSQVADLSSFLLMSSFFNARSFLLLVTFWSRQSFYVLCCPLVNRRSQYLYVTFKVIMR